MKINYKKILENYYEGLSVYGKAIAAQYDRSIITNYKAKNKNK